MKRLLWTLTALASAGILSACGGGSVVVTAQIEGQNGQTQPVDNLVVRVVPYDRDVLFDSLQAAFSRPEPEIPDSLLKMQSQIAQAQEEYSISQREWNAARDSLKQLNDQLAKLRRTDPKYIVLYRDYDPLDSRMNAAQRTMDAAFKRLDQLERGFADQANEIKLRREQWADEAFAPIDSIINARLKAMKLEEYADTTDAAGMTGDIQVPKGKWWVVARYRLVYQELYWNVPVEVKGGEPLQVMLDEKNAEKRPIL